MVRLTVKSSMIIQTNKLNYKSESIFLAESSMKRSEQFNTKFNYIKITYSNIHTIMLK